MKISDLAISSYGYINFTDYSASYQRFRDNVGYRCDLTNAEHRKALLAWLNNWGCRQFSKDYRRVSSKQILLWYEEYADMLFPSGKGLLVLNGHELEKAYEAFESLAGKVASIREKNEKKHRVTVGLTGASKILFAIRPEALVAWDKAIREGLKADGIGTTYIDFLSLVRSDMLSIKEECIRRNLSLQSLPKKLNRSKDTIPQLIGEYYWAKYTRGCTIPDWTYLKRLADWAR